MSVETLFENNSAALTNSIETQRDTKNKSPVYLAAEKIIEEARDEIKKLSDPVGEPGNTISQESIINALPPDQRRSFSLNFSALIFGNLLIGLENALVDQAFDHKEFRSRFNMSIQGTPVTRMESDDTDLEPLGQEWKNMVSIAKQDPTFATYFDREFAALPIVITKYLNVHLFQFMKDNIVPGYKRSVQGIIASR